MRQEINSTVREKPGIHFRELQRDVGCSSTTLNHHLPGLEVKEREIHGYRRLYPEEVSEEMERPLAALNHSVRGRMLYYIREGATPSGLVEKLDVSKSTVSTHLKILREDGVISEEPEGRRKKLYLSGEARKALKCYASQILDDVSEGFIEMWE